MGRILIKGGVWRNTEVGLYKMFGLFVNMFMIFTFKDEILKAAVMKYGKNQWSRVASLLHRKSAKQCKARWYEWLDPSIKKTEWSREEEEKLLHMAKMMPHQWRTIASIVGRTTSQCLEHYDYLLDQAQRKDEADTDDPRKLKPGEIDPNPETKPARPDPVDMDEDELEMLSEARARLANTQGKKAKRKARERQLEEARRLASLQKRRELRMAGIHLSGQSRRKKKGIDYNSEIPFEKPVPEGIHDTSNEIFKAPEHDFKKLRQQHLDGETKREREENEKKKDKKRKSENDASPLPSPTSQVKRSKLVLPAPQVSDTELEQVIKLGKASQSAKALAEEGGNVASETLLADYSVTPSEAASARTPKVAALSRDTILMEAQNLMALTNVETPLKGGLNTPLHEIEPGALGGINTPAGPISATPNNLLVAQFRTSTRQNENALITPGSVSSRGDNKVPQATPLRDKLNINPEDSLTFDTELAVRAYEKDAKHIVKMALSALPTPKKEFEIVLSEEEARILKDKESKANESTIIEDAADVEARREAEAAAELEAYQNRQTLAVQRNLPRPVKIPSVFPIKNKDPEIALAEKMVADEMLILLHYDALKNPTEKQLIAQNKTNQSKINEHEAFLEKNPFYEIDQHELEEARELVKEELLNLEESELPDKLECPSKYYEKFGQTWDKCYDSLTRCPLKGGESIIDLYKKQYSKNCDALNKESSKVHKLIKKLDVLFGGYKSRADHFRREMQEAFNQIEVTRIELDTYKMLQSHEDIAIRKRILSLTEDVDRQKERERLLQRSYDELIREKQTIVGEKTTSSREEVSR